MLGSCRLVSGSKGENSQAMTHMQAGGRNLAIVFIDICDSTGIFERQGDLRARSLIEAFLIDCAAALETDGGRVVKTLGDGLMCTFAGAESALAGARAVQKMAKGGDLHVRIGFHVGPVIESDSDVFGDAVNVAARVSSVAKADETLFTEAVVESLPAGIRISTRFLQEMMLKGRSEPTKIYGLVPLEAEGTLILQGAHRVSQAKRHLSLYYRQQRLEVSGVEKLWIGRDSQCDLVVEGDLVSRRHATIEAQDDRYTLTDQSTNGTFVALADDRRLCLKRETFQLVGSGQISLGRSPDDKEAELIGFQVE